MKVIRVPDGMGGFIRICEWEDSAFVDPVEHYREVVMASSIQADEDIILAKERNFPMLVMQNVLKKRAESLWVEKYAELKSVQIPEKLIKLLDCQSKGEQIKLLKGLSMTTDQYAAFFIYAGEHHGYTLSNYYSQHIPANLKKGKFPIVFHKRKDGSLTKIGETNLSDPKLTQVIEQRKGMVARFLDREDTWHCFYHTYRSIGGQENHNNGQPHLHYISNYWTIPRETIVSELKNKTQNFTSGVHIEFQIRND